MKFLGVSETEYGNCIPFRALLQDCTAVHLQTRSLLWSDTFAFKFVLSTSGYLGDTHLEYCLRSISTVTTTDFPQSERSLSFSENCELFVLCKLYLARFAQSPQWFCKVPRNSEPRMFSSAFFSTFFSF